MKKLLSIILTILMIVTMIPFTNVAFASEGGVTLYLKPSQAWLEDNARFSVYLSSGDWLSMSDTDGDGVYETELNDDTIDAVIFCRMDPDNPYNDWTAKWNATEYLFYDGTNNVYTVPEDKMDYSGDEYWSRTCNHPNGYENGACVDCKLKCLHNNYTDGFCDDCGEIIPNATVAVSKGDNITGYYVSLKDAVKAVESCAEEDKAIVKLLDEINLGKECVTVSSGTFTIDLNDKTLSSEESGVLGVNGDAVVTIKNGTVSASYDYGTVLYAHEGSMYIEDCTVINNAEYGEAVSFGESTGYIIDSTISGGSRGLYVDSNSYVTVSGDSEIIGRRISGIEVYYDSTVEIIGGTVTGVMNGVYSSSGFAIISGGSIIGGDADLYSDIARSNTFNLICSEGKDEGPSFPGGIKVAGKYYDADDNEYDFTLKDVIGEGMSYWQGNKMIVLTEGQNEIVGDVLIKAECVHESYTDGVCDVCGFECPHENQTGSVCEICGTTLHDDEDGNEFSDDLSISGSYMNSSTPYLASGSKEATATKPETGYAYWDAASNTLTLNNFTSATDAATGIFYVGSAETLRIELVGNNSVTGGNVPVAAPRSGVWVNNSGTNVIFSGGGTLTATGTGTGNSSGYGVCAWGDITVDSGTTLIATGFGNGVHSEGGSIIVDGGSLTGNGGESGGNGVHADSITVNGGSLTGTAYDNYGVYTPSGSITVSGDSHIVAICGNGNYISVGTLDGEYYSYSGDGTDKTFAHSTDAPLTGTVRETYFELVTAQHLSDTYTSNGDATHSRYCSCALHTKVTAPEACSGGTATCATLAVCENCGESYGEVDKNNHDETVAYVNGFCEYGCYEPAVDSDSDGYYEIGNAGQLYWFADKAKNDRTNYGSANAILTQNIVVNENVLTADGELNGFGSDFRAWIPPYAYKGTFDGAGKTVSGLYFKDTEERDVGFIGYLYGGTVKNLTVKDSYFNAYSAVGGIVGSVIEGTVTDCFSSATVIAGSLGYAGGIAGENGAGLVERCANSGFVTSGYEAGGIVGYNHNYYDDPDPAIIRHCYNIGSVSGYTVGGIVGYATQQVGSSVEIDSCWAACELNGTNSVGGLIGHASGSTIRCCSYDKTVFTGNPVGKKTSCNILDSGFKSTEEFASGDAAYLLNGKSSGGFWRQTIGTDAYPGFSGDKVYYGYISCADNAKKVYTNDATATEVKPAHNWSNNDGICANGCGYECTHVSYTGGVCDNCNYECPHTWGEGVLTRPTFGTAGYYTYTCTLCGHSYTEPAKEADTTALNDASMKVTEYIDNDTLTQEAKDEIYKSYRDILKNNGNIFDEFGFVRNDLVEEDQPAINAVTAELEKIVADAEEKIASGEYVKADYTEIDEAIDDIEEKLASENVTDEGKAELEEIKKQLEEMKADENTSEADLAELEKELEAYEEELDKGIEDGTLVEVDVEAIIDDVNKKWAEKLEAEGLLDEYEDFINNQKATDEAMATVDEINDFANSLEGTVAENAENIAKLNEMLDSLRASFENCLRGTHNFNDYEVTSPAKCEVNAIETRTCWFCGETDEREVEGTALKHSFTKYEVTEEAECGKAGKEVAYCDNGCQTTDEREIPALEHIFLDYVSNGDATCTADGTKTASCIHGCGATDTVADEGSMIDHSDEDGDDLCDDCGGEIYERCDICGGKAHGDDKIKLVFCMIITIIRFVTSILKSIN